MSKILVLILFLSVLLPVESREDYIFSPINSHNGLSEDGIHSITQLKDGRMVIITDGLVNLYDGTSFRYLHINDGEVYPLKKYQAYHRPYVDQEGQLWIKDYRRLLLFDIRKECFVPSIDSVLFGQGVKDPLADFYMDSQSNFWYLTDKDVLLYKNKSSDKASIFISQLTSLPSRRSDLEDVAVFENKVFLFFKSGEMICMDLHTKEEILRENPLDGKIVRQQDQIIRVTLCQHYLYKICNDDQQGILLRYDILQRKWEPILQTSSWLNTLSLDKQGDIWLSSSKGVWHVSKNLQQKRLIPCFQLIDGTTIEAPINDLYHDKQAGLWLGTDKRGLLYYHQERFKFEKISKENFAASSSSFRVNSLAEDKEKILIGTSEGLFELSADKQIIRHKDLPFPIICHSMLKDKEQRIWICCGSNGLYCIDGKKLNHYRFPSQNVYHICQDTDGSLYLCLDKGFGIFNPLSGQCRSIETTEKLNIVYQFAPIGENRLIGLSDMGIFIYDRKTKSVDLTGTYDKKRPEIFSQNHHRYDCLLSDSRALIWIGSRDGLSVYNQNKKKLQIFHSENGLINNRIQSLIEDRDGNIWVATSYGISRIAVKANKGAYQYTFSNYNQYDGVLSREFCERSVLKTSSGLLLWGGIEGINRIDPGKINTIENQIPTPLFSKLFLFGSEIKQEQKYDGEVLLRQAPASTTEIQLNHRQNFITFEFSALNYINPTQTYYKYQLSGIDQQPQEIYAENGIGRANYTNLSPGSYTLKVYAGNNNKNWSPHFAQIKITITPPFWKTPIAYLLYLLLVLLAFYCFTSYYLRRSQQRIAQKHKEDLEQMKYKFFTNISHELRTPLTLIMTPLDSLIKKTEDNIVRSQLKNIYRHATGLLDLVNQLLDFRKTEAAEESLCLSYCHIGELIDSITSSFQELAASKDIESRLENQADSLYAYIDTDKLRKVFNNLLSNGYKFTPKGGKITTRIFSDRDHFVVEIEDTGIGIGEKDIPFIFNRFYQTSDPNQPNTGSGIGLHLAQEYVHLHQGSIGVQSQKNKGSVFSVKIPLNLHPDLKQENSITTPNKEVKHSLSILIAEDHDDFRLFLSEQLSEFYQTEVAANGQEALNKAIEKTPDIIISDIMMPQMTGLELCKAVKQDIRTSHIPIILLTARSSENAQLEGYGSGADAYISKPFNMEILLVRIANLVEQIKRRKELFKKAIIIQPESITATKIDEKLVEKALQCIEKNFTNTDYSVEQLAQDMNMDRTGLYRKLMAITGQSPTLFIRSVRLKRGASLLQSGHSVSEVAEMVGFNTIGYFSKCFQEEFGVKASGYAHQPQ